MSKLKFNEYKKRRLVKMKWFCLTARLIVKARERHEEKIYPVGGRKRFSDGLSIYGSAACLWYDTPDGSTHIAREEL